MMVYSVGNITECVELGRNEARLVAQGLRLVHCDLSGLLEAEGPEDRAVPDQDLVPVTARSEEHTSELQSLMRISYAVFCLKTKKTPQHQAKLWNRDTHYTRRDIEHNINQ